MFSCKNETKKDEVNDSGLSKVIVQEVLQVRDYSYIRVLDGDSEKWIAAPTTPVEIGGVYYFGNTMEMKNFESKDLNKTFETIYFVEKISLSKDIVEIPLKKDPHPVTDETTNIVVEENKVENGTSGDVINITIEELFKDKNLYSNTMVRLRGEVTKFNPAIMNTNWIHIKDGTDQAGKFDLTVTSKETVAIGDVVTLEGKVILDKDFGAGYFYEVLLDNARIIK